MISDAHLPPGDGHRNRSTQAKIKSICSPSPYNRSPPFTSSKTNLSLWIPFHSKNLQACLIGQAAFSSDHYLANFAGIRPSYLLVKKSFLMNPRWWRLGFRNTTTRTRHTQGCIAGVRWVEVLEQRPQLY